MLRSSVAQITEGVRNGRNPVTHYRGPVFDSSRWRDFELRPDDIVISTPSKSGTTWAQMICALLIFQDPVLPQPLSALSPWLDMLSRAKRDVFADLEAQTHRRFIKTHTPLDGLPRDASVTYVCVGRDPRDVALSMDNHMENLDFGRFLAARNAAAAIDGVELPLPPLPPRAETKWERFWRWVDDDTPPSELSSSLRRALHHFQLFFDAPAGTKVVFLHFEDLQSDLEGQMRSLADRLGIIVPEESWDDLVRAATFGEMRAHADDLAPCADAQFWRDNQRFFNRGTTGQWRELLDDADLERYRARVRSVGRPDVVDWVHHHSL